MDETEDDPWAATRRSLERRQEEEPTATRRGRGCLFWSAVAAAVILIPIIILTFVVAPFKVVQDSMAPTIDPGDWVLIDKLTPRISAYARGDVVLVKRGGSIFAVIPAYLARIEGQPGDTVEFKDGSVYVTPSDGPRQREGAAPKFDTFVPRDPLDPSKGSIVVSRWCAGRWVLKAGEYFLNSDDLREGKLIEHYFECPAGGSHPESFEGRVWLW